MFPDQSSSILSTNLHYLYQNKTLKLSTNPPTSKERVRGKDQSKERQEKDSFRKANMVLLDQLWDDVLAGPHPEQGLGKLRKPLKLGNGGEGEGSKYQRSLSMPAGPSTPPTPGTPMTPSSAKKEDVWRSVFNPGRNFATKDIGAAVFDKPQANTPTVYDWLYSDDTRSKHR